MSENTQQSTKHKSSKSQIIGIRFPEEIAVAIKQEAARRNIRLNRLILELWDRYQEEKKGS
jgi:predicted DNA binding CopG/RHH family protein